MDKLIVTTHDELSTLIEEAVQKGIAVSKTKSTEYANINEFLTISQASSFLNLARQTLYGFTSNQTIPFFKKGKKLYFKKSDLEKWLSEGRKITRDELGAALSQIEKGGKHG
jgi:excisionase family DNA binding protein